MAVYQEGLIPTLMHEFPKVATDIETNFYFDTDDEYYFGYNDEDGVCRRPREVYATREFVVGGVAGADPQYAFLADGECGYGDDATTYIRDAQSNNIYGLTLPFGIVSSRDTQVLFVSSLLNGADENSFYMLADVNAAAIDDDHNILTLAWRDNVDANNDAIYFRHDEIAINDDAQAQVLGTETDAADAVAVQIGAENDFTTAGARLLEIINDNGGDVRAAVDLDGDLLINMLDNGQQVAIESLTELTTIAAAASTDTTIQIPQDALVLGVSVRVTTAIPAPTTDFDVGVAGAVNRYGDALNTGAGTTNPGTDDAVRFYNAATAIRLTMNGGNPGAATGRVRVTIHFIRITAPTS